MCGVVSLGVGLRSNDVYLLATSRLAGEVGLASAAELHDTVDECEECVVLADTDVCTCEHLSAALAYDNRTGLGYCTIVQLYPEILRIGIGEVFSATSSFSVCHTVYLYLWSAVYASFSYESRPTRVGISIARVGQMRL